MIKRLLIFVVINFLALAIGAQFTSVGANADWYMSLDKAPWTPPGWFFSAAWSTIMALLAIYMAILWPRVRDKSVLITWYGAQILLNIVWNPVFFTWHYVFLGLVIISILTGVVGMIMYRYRSFMGVWSWLLAPYVIWLAIATSLNAYIWIFN